MVYKNICKSLSFNECELTILRLQVDASETKHKNNKNVLNSFEYNKIFKLVETFLKKKKNVCYGGIAIDALLPDNDKIYDTNDLPDYDFFSPNALSDAKELADIYLNNGYSEVEAKSGQHHGTYKVFVNFEGVADITNVPHGLFNVIKKKSVNKNGILYTDPNFLRMSMYLELSRPDGDTSRWEKIFKRLSVINKYYPIKNYNCNQIEFQRKMDNDDKKDTIYGIAKDTFINNDVVFFGGFAISQYSRYMPVHTRNNVKNIADFDVIYNEPLELANILKQQLKQNGINNVEILKKNPIGEIIPLNYEIKVGNDTIAFIYKPLACHSYNVLSIYYKKIKIATIDTMLSFYLAFMYANKPYYDINRILCMCNFLFDVQQKNRLEQKGLLKRFSINCYGKQQTIQDLKREKASKFNELQNKKGTLEYDEWFLNYNGSKYKKKIKNKTITKIKNNNTNLNKKTKKNLFW
jgi:hypothetical protein